jgi:outer membrane cobalamin receptor
MKLGNFDKNFMPLYITAFIMLVMMIAFDLKAEENNNDYIEEIVVVGSLEILDATDVSQDLSLIETLMPATSFVAGGYGGAALFNERGAQTVHTTVYRNGVPVNDAGAGWYDFAHDIVSGLESVKVVSGPNGVLYGSGSLGGTVFINDEISNQGVVRIGEDHRLLNVALFDAISITSFDVVNDSVRNDNTEQDDYKNTTIKSVKDVLGFTVAMSHVDYDYDYDNCYTASFSQSNDCLQSGEKTDISIRNNNLTLGYSNTDSEYFTEGVSTWQSDAKRYYFDARESFELGYPPAKLIAGITYDKEEYAGENQDNVSGYATINFRDTFQVGARISEDATVYRVGYELEGLYGNFSTSYRNPTLYQQYGDSWVQPNPNLQPEEGMGIELGYIGFSLFSYKFEENIDYDGTISQYVNTGKYDTKGIRFQDTYPVPYGSLNVFLAYTDTDQPRVPEYKGSVSYFASFGNSTAELRYRGQFEREPGPYDGAVLEDISSIDFVLTRKVSDKFEVSLTVQDLLDDVTEILPGYNVGGQKIFLTFSLR